MKYLKKLGIAFLITVGSLFILLFIATIFNYFDLFSYKVMHISIIIVPIISLILGGLYIGKKATKKGYLEGLKLGLLFSILLLIINLILGEGINLKDIIFYLILIISCIFGSMIGINLKKS